MFSKRIAYLLLCCTLTAGCCRGHALEKQVVREFSSIYPDASLLSATVSEGDFKHVYCEVTFATRDGESVQEVWLYMKQGEDWVLSKRLPQQNTRGIPGG